MLPLTLEFVVFPMAQDVHGKVVDQQGFGIENATVQVRYHEPDRPLRRASFHDFHQTYVADCLLLRDVGINIPFFVDVHALGYRPISSQRNTLAKGDAQFEDIVLENRGGILIVRVLDSSNAPLKEPK